MIFCKFIHYLSYLLFSACMGPVRMKDVEEAQQKIVAVIRKLEDAGEIVISRGGGDDIVV